MAILKTSCCNPPSLQLLSRGDAFWQAAKDIELVIGEPFCPFAEKVNAGLLYTAGAI